MNIILLHENMGREAGQETRQIGDQMPHAAVRNRIVTFRAREKWYTTISGGKTIVHI